MRVLRRLLKRLAFWSSTTQDENRLKSEIEEHLALQTAEYLRAGLSPEEARRQALLKFGAVEAMKEDYRDQRGLPFVESLVQDTRHALRRLRKSPAFTGTVILTLALGIGADHFHFHVGARRLAEVAGRWRTRPSCTVWVKNARCCYWGGYSQEGEFSIFSYDLVRTFSGQHSRVCGVGGLPGGRSAFWRLARGGSRRQPRVIRASSFPAITSPCSASGRMPDGCSLTPTIEQGALPVAVMSYRLWQQQYGSDPSVIGGAFSLDQNSFIVVGITPPGFFGDKLRAIPPDFFLPLNTEPLVEADSNLDQPDSYWLDIDRARASRRGLRIHRGGYAGGTQAVAALALGRHER